MELRDLYDGMFAYFNENEEMTDFLGKKIDQIENAMHPEDLIVFQCREALRTSGSRQEIHLHMAFDALYRIRISEVRMNLRQYLCMFRNLLYHLN